MNRRSFLGSLAACAVAPLVPNQAPRSGVRPNIAPEDIARYLDSIVPMTITHHYHDSFEWKRCDVGKTITVTMPQRFQEQTYASVADRYMK